MQKLREKIMFDELDMLDNFDSTIQALDQELHILQQYKNILDQIAIVSKTDIYGTITYVNGKFCEVSGYTQDELIGQPHNIVRHPDMPKEAFEDIWRTIKDKQSWQGIVKNRKKDGSAYILHSHIFPILSSDQQKIEEFISVRFDLTKDINRKALSDLEQAKIQLQAWLKGVEAFYLCSSAYDACMEQVPPGLMTLKEWVNKYNGPLKVEGLLELGETYENLAIKVERLVQNLHDRKIDGISELWDSVESDAKSLITQINHIAQSLQV